MVLSLHKKTNEKTPDKEDDASREIPPHATETWSLPTLRSVKSPDWKIDGRSHNETRSNILRSGTKENSGENMRVSIFSKPFLKSHEKKSFTSPPNGEEEKQNNMNVTSSHAIDISGQTANEITDKNDSSERTTDNIQKYVEPIIVNDFNDFLLNNSPINLSPENSDEEDEDENDMTNLSSMQLFKKTVSSDNLQTFFSRRRILASQTSENWALPPLHSGKPLDSPSLNTGDFSIASRDPNVRRFSSLPLQVSAKWFATEPVDYDNANSSSISSDPTSEESPNFPELVKENWSLTETEQDSKTNFPPKAEEKWCSREPSIGEHLDEMKTMPMSKMVNPNYPHSQGTNKISSPTVQRFSNSEENTKKQKKKIFTKLTYENVEKNVSKYYLQNKTSNKFDVLITYLHSKKNIYIQSQNLLQIYLSIINTLTLILTATVAIFAPFMYNYNWSSYFISAVNSMIAILIKLKDGLKYESNIENYNKLSNQFNNLETSMQLTSNKLQFITDEDKKTKIIIEKIEYLEERLNDINNNFKMIFPEIIKKIFPIITHINIFTFIKKIETYKHFLIIDLQNVKNEIMYITHKWNMNENIMMSIEFSLEDQDNITGVTYASFRKNNKSSPVLKNEYFPSHTPENWSHPTIRSGESLKFHSESSENWSHPSLRTGEALNLAFSGHNKLLFINDKIRLQNLLKIKENIKIKIFHYKKIYEYIDEIFNEEIKSAESSSYWLYMILFYKKNKDKKKDYDNPIVKELIKFAI